MPCLWQFRFLGEIDYDEAFLEQQRAFEAVRQSVESGAPQAIVLGLTHPPTITLGRHAREDTLLASQTLLQARGVKVVRTDRGGDVTYHGPEQAMLYPIVPIGHLGLGPKPWARVLEQCMARYVASMGLESSIRDDVPGVFVGEHKVGFLGLRIREGVSMHGLAVNLGGSLEAFSWMHPCGHPTLAVSSIEVLTGKRPPLSAATEALQSILKGLLRLS